MSAAKRKGTAWESCVVDFLRTVGFRYAERRALAGAKDLGDITGIPDVVIECKSQNRQSLGEWLDEAKAERANAAARIGVVWFKRRGKGSAGDGYVLMDGHTFAVLLREAGYGGAA
jgi:hypothetical protein